ncbi:hypothetical protein [Stenotrophomonas lactitubi]
MRAAFAGLRAQFQQRNVFFLRGEIEGFAILESTPDGVPADKSLVRRLAAGMAQPLSTSTAQIDAINASREQVQGVSLALQQVQETQEQAQRMGQGEDKPPVAKGFPCGQSCDTVIGCPA